VLLVRWVGGVIRAAPWVALATGLATAAALYYAVGHLRIDTNREKMFSQDLPFQQAYAHYREEFPQFVDNLVLVIDADIPERARRDALGLAARLEARPRQFAQVYLPRASEFLTRHALLFLDVDALQDLVDRLAEVQPFFGKLTRDPSLRGLFAMLQSAL